MDAVEGWIEKSPYTSGLGVELAELTPERALLRLPYRDENSNPGKALHGGCAASLSVVGSQALTRALLAAESGPWHTAALQINYLAAAIGENVTAEARLLRRGKAMCFVEVDVKTDDGKPIAHATTAVRARFGVAPAAPVPARGDDGTTDPGPMGPFIQRVPFIGNRGIHVELMANAHSRLTMAAADANADENGCVHEGAVLALLDTTGAMASWADTGPGPYKASTPSLQAHFLAPPGRGDLVGYGRVVQRDGSSFWSDVEIADVSDGAVCARGTVLYRILT